jgi:glycosyltransferase involved in cell wall biosynthesis
LDGNLSYHLTVVQWPGSREAARLVEELAPQGRFSYLEGLSTEQVVQAYARAQLLVSPSLYEGFGLPAAEALACGTPVVATTAGALPDIVEDGVSGLLVPPGEVEPLAKAIRTLLEDPERCRAMGEAGARWIREKFSWRRTAEETLALYQEVLSRHKSPQPSVEPSG